METLPEFRARLRAQECKLVASTLKRHQYILKDSAEALGVADKSLRRTLNKLGLEEIFLLNNNRGVAIE